MVSTVSHNYILNKKLRQRFVMQIDFEGKRFQKITKLQLSYNLSQKQRRITGRFKQRRFSYERNINIISKYYNEGYNEGSFKTERKGKNIICSLDVIMLYIYLNQ